MLMQVDPVKGNVAFAAAQAGWSFTLHSFAQLYCTVYGQAMDLCQVSCEVHGQNLCVTCGMMTYGCQLAVMQLSPAYSLLFLVPQDLQLREVIPAHSVVS